MIEKALYEHLQKQESLYPLLARYREGKAIFNQEAPDDKDPGWDGAQYPRVVFAVDMTEDPERNISGILAVDIICNSEKQLPEEIEPVLKRLIDGYFLMGANHTFSARWTASNYFTEPAQKISGATLTFSLLAFPVQETIEPDPIQLLNREIKERYPDAFVIGLDRPLETAWKPTNESPTMYWRLHQTTPCPYLPDTYSCIWRTAALHLHVITEDRDAAVSLVREISFVLSTYRRLIFPDDSPLMIDRVSVEAGNEPQRVGQLVLEATFGMLRPRVPAHPIKNIHMKGATQWQM